MEIPCTCSLQFLLHQASGLCTQLQERRAQVEERDQVAAIMAQRSRRNSYSELQYLIQRSFEGCPGFGSRVEVDGKLNRIAEGLWHDNYWFRIQGPDIAAAQLEQAYVLRLLDQREDWQARPAPDLCKCRGIYNQIL